ncbi:unnamed protein product [Effrenium voratum]|nr:unnamed protein product [Effrenium voratum]
MNMLRERGGRKKDGTFDMLPPFAALTWLSSGLFHGSKDRVEKSVDSDLLKRLQAELDLLKMKLASAERELSKMEALKSELESLKKQLGERDVKIEELEAEIKRLTELLKKSAKSEGKPGKKEPKAPKEEKEAKKEKRYKQDTGPARESPSKPTVAATEGEDKPPPAEKPPEPDEATDGTGVERGQMDTCKGCKDWRKQEASHYD